jgi:hypothetical protein
MNKRFEIRLEITYDGNQRRTQILKTKPAVSRYEQVVELPATTIQNEIQYEVTVYLDGISWKEQEVRQFVASWLESPVFRARSTGRIVKLPGDKNWNVIYIFDTGRKQYGVIQARVEDKKIEIAGKKGGEMRIAGYDPEEYPKPATRAVYEKMGYEFEDMEEMHIGLRKEVCVGRKQLQATIKKQIEKETRVVDRPRNNS